MAYFDWTAEFETGIKQIDDQHKKLIGYVNELIDALREGKGNEITGSLVLNLLEYAKTHFMLEEKAFYRFDYYDAERHTKEHHEFIKKVQQFNEAHKRQEVLLGSKLSTFLVDWVKNHILYEDMKYVPFLKDMPWKNLQ